MRQGATDGQGIENRVYILIAHGSRSHEANEAVMRLAERIADRLGSYPVLPAFWELAVPTLKEAVQAAVTENKAAQITVLPLFLSDGMHVRRDIPQALDALRLQYPEVTITCLPSLQEDPLLEDLLVRRLERQE